MFRFVAKWLNRLMGIQLTTLSRPWDRSRDLAFTEWMARRGFHPRGNAGSWSSDE